MITRPQCGNISLYGGAGCHWLQKHRKNSHGADLGGHSRPALRAILGGRPVGSRHKTTLAMEALLDSEAEKLTRKAVEMALAGDTVALRLCLDRLTPPRKDRPILFAMPRIETTAHVVKASAALLQAVASGELTPSEAAELGKLIEAHVRAIEVTEIQERLARLEAQQR